MENTHSHVPVGLLIWHLDLLLQASQRTELCSSALEHTRATAAASGLQNVSAWPAHPQLERGQAGEDLWHFQSGGDKDKSLVWQGSPAPGLAFKGLAAGDETRAERKSAAAADSRQERARVALQIWHEKKKKDEQLKYASEALQPQSGHWYDAQHWLWKVNTLTLGWHWLSSWSRMRRLDGSLQFVTIFALFIATTVDQQTCLLVVASIFTTYIQQCETRCVN